MYFDLTSHDSIMKKYSIAHGSRKTAICLKNSAMSTIKNETFSAYISAYETYAKKYLGI